MNYKACTKCGKKFPATTDYFYMCNGKFGLRSQCKGCCSECRKQRYRKNRDKELKQTKKYQQTKKGKEVMRRATKKYQQSKKGKKTAKEYRESERGKKIKREYRKSEKSKRIRKEIDRRHYEENKLSHSMSSMVYQSLKGNKAGRHWETLVPYTLDQLKQYLEKLFQPEMAWDNYGMSGWHVDHKIPKSKFKFTNPEDKEFQECWALENLQPLWAEENLSKHDKLDWKK